MKKVLLCGLILMALSSCVKHDNVYQGGDDDSKKKEEYDKNFPVKDIDPDQDWSNFASIKVNMTVYEDLGEAYTVKLYTANPMDEEAGPLLLAKSEVKHGETSSVTVEVPEDLKSLWAVRLDKHNRCLFKQGVIKNGVADVTFGSNDSDKRALDSRAVAVRMVEAPALPYTDEEVADLIEGEPTVIGKEKEEITDSGVYLVPETATISNLSASGNGVIIIVQGEVKQATVKGGAEFILYGSPAVAGKLSGDMDISNKSLLYAMPGSIFSLDKLIVQNQSKVYLKGQDNKVSRINTLNSDATSTFINYYGRLTLGTAAAVNLENYCYMELTSNSMSTISNLKMGQHSYLSAESLQTTTDRNLEGKDKKGDWYLDNYSIVDIKSNFRAIRSDISGPETGGYALLRVRKNYEYNVEGSSNEGIDVGYLINNIYVELETIWGGKTQSIYKLIQGLNGAGQINGQVTHGNGNATLTLLYNAPVYIPPSECSGEGNKPTDEGDGLPEDKKIAYTFAFEDMGSIGDYDFNDVVVHIMDNDDSRKFDVYLVAAGGTIPVKVELWNTITNKYVTLWEEIHSAFGVSPTMMVNTGNGATVTAFPKKEALYKEDYLEKSLYSNAKFKITVIRDDGTTAESEIISTPTRGGVPQCLRIAGRWKWPLETKGITLAYPLFEKWGQGLPEGANWYNKPDEQYTYNK